MKIAVVGKKGIVEGHFGHCEGFTIFTSEDKSITHTETVDNPGHTCKSLPEFLAAQGVDVVISGGMGKGAMEGLKAQGIDPIIGASGDAQMAAETYLQGNLKSTGSLCAGHSHGAGHSCHH